MLKSKHYWIWGFNKNCYLKTLDQIELKKKGTYQKLHNSLHLMENLLRNWQWRKPDHSYNDRWGRNLHYLVHKGFGWYNNPICYHNLKMKTEGVNPWC